VYPKPGALFSHEEHVSVGQYPDARAGFEVVVYELLLVVSEVGCQALQRCHYGGELSDVLSGWQNNTNWIGGLGLQRRGNNNPCDLRHGEPLTTIFDQHAIQQFRIYPNLGVTYWIASRGIDSESNCGLLVNVQS
jgi:hypothetical protein